MGTWIDVPNSSSGNARGVVIPVRKVEREERHETKIQINQLDRKTTAKTYRGYLQGSIAKARNDDNKELVVLFEELLAKFNSYYPEKIIKIEIIQGWKNYGEAHPEIWKGFDNDFRIKIWHNSGFEVKDVKKEDINRVLLEIKQMKPQETISCYEMAFRLGYGQDPKRAWKNLWANRMNEYFPHYYTPLLILRELGIVKHEKKGNLTRAI